MNIVYATDNYWPRISGVAVSIDAFKNVLVCMGHTVHILAPNYPGAKEHDRKHGTKKIHRFHSHSMFFSKEDQLVSPFVKKQVLDVLKKIKPDLIHVQTELVLGRWVLDYAKERHIPVVMTCHTYFEGYISIYLPHIPPWVTRPLIKREYVRLFNKADHIIVPTPHMHEILRSYGIVRPIMNIPTGITGSRGTPPAKESVRKRSKLIRMFPILTNKNILLYLGRLAKEKNIGFLLEVFKRVRSTNKDTVMLIVGDGPYKKDLERMARDLGISDHVVFTGYVSEAMKSEAYSIANVFIFASKTETQGIVTIEAMNHGTPVVAIGVRGTKDVMNGDNGGFMVSDDLADFTDHVMRFLKDPPLMEKKSMEAFDYSKNWTIDRSMPSITNVYNKVLNDRLRPHGSQRKNFIDPARGNFQPISTLRSCLGPQ